MRKETDLNDVLFSILFVHVSVYAGVLLRPLRSPRVLGRSVSGSYDHVRDSVTIFQVFTHYGPLTLESRRFIHRRGKYIMGVKRTYDLKCKTPVTSLRLTLSYHSSDSNTPGRKWAFVRGIYTVCLTNNHLANQIEPRAD